MPRVRSGGAEPCSSQRHSSNSLCLCTGSIHMANIKQTRLLPRPVMTINMAQIRILQRHRKPRKRNHPRTMRNMQIIQLCLASCLRRRKARLQLRQRRSESSYRASSGGRAEAEGLSRAIGDDRSGLGSQRPCAKKADTSSQWLEAGHYELMCVMARDCKKMGKSHRRTRENSRRDNGKVTWR